MDEEDNKAQLEHYKAELEHYKIQYEEWKDITASARSYAEIAIKSGLALNGGAALAFLALIGHMYTTNNPKFEDIPTALAPSLISFGWGAVLAVITAMFAYLTELSYARCLEVKDDESELKKYKSRVRTAVIFHFLSIVLAALSISVFISGMYEAYYVFKQIKS